MDREGYSIIDIEGKVQLDEQEGKLYGLKLKEHYEGIHQSCKILKINPLLSLDVMVEATIALLQKNRYQQDLYIRPLVYKSAQIIKLRRGSQSFETVSEDKE